MAWNSLTEKDKILEYYNYCKEQQNKLLAIYLNILNYRDFKLLVLENEEFNILFNECLEGFESMKENLSIFVKDINDKILNDSISSKIIEDYAKLIDESFEYCKYVAKLIEDKLKVESKDVLLELPDSSILDSFGSKQGIIKL